MHFDIFTLFPGMFAGIFDDSILKRAREAGIISVALHNIRDYALGRHRITDDTPYGGGGGMVMKPEPIFRAVETVLSHEPGWSLSGPAAAAGEGSPAEGPNEEPASDGPAVALPPDVPIILLSPQGRTFTQAVAQELAGYRRIALICGRYEGVDERVRTGLATDEISIGDFVISGGELAAAIIVDAVTRLLPGALGCEMGAYEDSFATGLLEYPQYTRPAVFRGQGIPEILTSGDHARVARWRREQALRRTWERRPDLLRSAPLSDADRAFLARLEQEHRSAGDSS
ncbi:MAG: tRNA (guanosine(37)-N1)-methyltransferase TrmD [Anaerolineae bacterium]